MTSTSCIACHYPLTANDRFCSGCGQAVAAEPVVRACKRCGKPVPEGGFCSHCGARLQTGGTPAKVEFQWKWAALSVPIVVGTTFAWIVALAIACVVTDTNPGSLAAGIAALFLGMFTGGMLAGFLSPARTVFEPGVGIAATLVVINLFMGNASGVLMGWLIPFGVGSLGAALGEYLQQLRTKVS